ncbi:hypothetical protein pb186bvf_012423 [Paramecium bursaria]
MQKIIFRISFRPKANGIKNGFRFENHNVTWTFNEFDIQSDAFAYGLKDQGWQVGEKILFLLGRSNTTEAITAFVGAAKAGVISVPFRANDAKSIEQAINTVNPQGIVFSPNQVVGEQKFIEIIQNLIPEAKQASQGLPLKSRFSNLRWLVHTGFYSYPGTYKFRESLTYASKNFNRLSLPEKVDGPIAGELEGGQLKLYTEADLLQLYQKFQNTKNVIVSGDPQTVQSYSVAIGGLNTGNLSVFTGNEKAEKLQKILQYYQDASLIVDSALIENQSHIAIEQNIQNIYTSGDIQTVGKVFQRQAVQI